MKRICTAFFIFVASSNAFSSADDEDKKDEYSYVHDNFRYTEDLEDGGFYDDRAGIRDWFGRWHRVRHNADPDILEMIKNFSNRIAWRLSLFLDTKEEKESIHFFKCHGKIYYFRVTGDSPKEILRYDKRNLTHRGLRYKDIVKIEDGNIPEICDDGTPHMRSDIKEKLKSKSKYSATSFLSY